MPINIRGKEYITVAERVMALHDDEPESVSVTSEIISHEPVVIKSTVVINGNTFTGISAANPSKAIEKMSPYEVAETSAVGRALGFAGYGIVESIASADEMAKINLPEASDLKMFCKIHSVEMRSAIGKSGKEYWGHKVDGEICFGKGTKTEQEVQKKKRDQINPDDIPF